MPSSGANLINTFSLTIKAVDRINQTTGGRDSILRNSTSGGAAVTPASLGSSTPSISKIPEAGKGAKLNTSA